MLADEAAALTEPSSADEEDGGLVLSELQPCPSPRRRGSNGCTTTHLWLLGAACSSDDGTGSCSDDGGCDDGGDGLEPPRPPAGGCARDADGDLLPARRRLGGAPRRALSLRHALSTTEGECGQQLWLGSCVLADWLLATQQRARVDRRVVLELGAGVGLASIAAARAGARVLCTDASAAALALAARNAAANGVGSERLRVRRLDWLQLFDTRPARLPDAELLALLNGGGCGAPGAAPWGRADLGLLARASLLLAADVVYDEARTDAFVRAAHALSAWIAGRRRQRPGRRGPQGPPPLVVALLRRVNFTLRALAPAAPAHEHFLSYLRVVGSDGCADGAASAGGARGGRGERAAAPLFEARRLQLSAVPRALDYERCDGLELWQLVALNTES